MKYEKWTVAPPDPAALAALEEAGISPLLAAVLSARGVRAPQEARALLEGGETALEDPLALKDMAQAAGRVRLALERGETIAVYGDYEWMASPPPAADRFPPTEGRGSHPLYPRPAGGGLRPEPGGGDGPEGAGRLPDRHGGLRHYCPGGDRPGPGPWGSMWSSRTTTSARAACPPPRRWWTPGAATAPAPARAWPAWGWP